MSKDISSRNWLNIDWNYTDFVAIQNQGQRLHSPQSAPRTETLLKLQPTSHWSSPLHQLNQDNPCSQRFHALKIIKDHTLWKGLHKIIFTNHRNAPLSLHLVSTVPWGRAAGVVSWKMKIRHLNMFQWVTAPGIESHWLYVHPVWLFQTNHSAEQNRKP